MKRFLSMLIALCMVISMLPVAAFAADNVVASGTAKALEDAPYTVIDHYKAPADGIITVTAGSADCTASWICQIFDWSVANANPEELMRGPEDTENGVATVEVEVEKGVKYTINFVGQDLDENGQSDAFSNVPYTITFVAAEGGDDEEEDLGEIMTDINGTLMSGSNVATTNAEQIVHEFIPSADGVIAICILDASTGWKFTGDGIPVDSGTGPYTYANIPVKAGVQEPYRIVLGCYKSYDWAKGTISYEIRFLEKTLEVEKNRYEFSDIIISEFGEYDIPMLLDSAEMTVVAVTPDELGVYELSVPEGTALLNNVGAGSHYIFDWDKKTATTTIEWTCQEIGQELMLGIVSDEDTVTVTYAKTGDYTPPAVVEVQPYVNKATLKQFALSADAVLGDYINVKESHSAVYNEDDEYYHLDSADGDILLVDMNYLYRLSSRLEDETGMNAMNVSVYDENNVLIERWDIADAVLAYEAVCDSNGYYPLTEDLMYFYNDYIRSSHSFDIILGSDYDEDTAWMYACLTMGEYVEEDPANGSFKVLGGDYYDWIATMTGEATFTGKTLSGDAAEFELYYEETDDAVTSDENGVLKYDVIEGEAYEFGNYEDDAIVITYEFATSDEGDEGDEPEQPDVPIEEVGKDEPTDLTTDLINEGDFSATVTVPARTACYFQAYRVGGMLMSINGGEPVECVTTGMWYPYIWSITNEGTEAAEYVITVGYPLGSYENPEVIEDMSNYWGEVSQAEGDFDGYYYTYTAPADGVVAAGFVYGVLEETLKGYDCDIQLINLNTYEQKSLKYDGVDNYGMEVTMDVAEGDEIIIQIMAIEDADGNFYPAAEMMWNGTFQYPAGSEQNPIYIEWNWDDPANVTATVTVEAGKTVYYYGFDGMILTVNGVETEQVASVFSITNDGDAEATYELAMVPPVGSYENPEVIEDINGFADSNYLEENVYYYYIWTAEEDATVILDVTDGANIAVEKLTYVEGQDYPDTQVYLLADVEYDENWNSYWIVKEELEVEVEAGQQLKIGVSALTDFNLWTAPAIDYTLTCSYSSGDENPDVPGTDDEEPASGTEQNPIDLTSDLLYEDDFRATVTIPAGTTYYFQAYRVGGMLMSINDGEPVECVITGMWSPYNWSITNDGASEAEYVITVNYPVGTMENPAELVMGENVAEIAAGSQGYFYTWTAEADGTLTVTMPEGDWTYVINNLSSYAYGDMQWSDSDPVVNPAVVEVSAGDEIQLIVNTYDPNDMWSNPAGELVITAEFAYPEGTVAKIGSVLYNSIEDVIASAVSGDTITLLADAEISDLKVKKGITLDLNGYTLTAEYASIYKDAHIIDRSEDNSGLLVVDPDCIMINVNNAALPVWTGEGFALMPVTFNTRHMPPANKDAFKFMFKPYLVKQGAEANSLFADGSEDNHVEIIVRVKWEGKDGVGSQDYIYKEEYVKPVFGGKSAFTLEFSSVSDLFAEDQTDRNITVEAIVRSSTGVEITSGAVIPQIID